MTIQSAMPKQSSEFPIALYTHLVSFSNIRSILSNIKRTAQNLLYQAMRDVIKLSHIEALFQAKNTNSTSLMLPDPFS